MSTTRTYTVFIKKEDIEKLRYGRKDDGSLAPTPIFKPWTNKSFEDRHIFVVLNAEKENEQIIIPTKVTAVVNGFQIEGRLKSSNQTLNAEEEHNVFTANNTHRELANSRYMIPYSNNFMMIQVDAKKAPKVEKFVSGVKELLRQRAASGMASTPTSETKGEGSDHPKQGSQSHKKNKKG